MLMVPSRDDSLVIPTPPSFAVASGTVDDDPSNSAIHLRRAQFIESPSKRRAISSTTSAHHDPSIDRLTSSFTSSPQATTDDSPSVHRGCPSPFAPVELYPPQHNAEGSSPNNQIRDGTESTTTTTNQSTAPPHLVPFDEIPERNLRIIKDAIAEVYRIHTPRDFQIEAINHLITNDDTYLILIRRTADGKSLVPLTVATIRCDTSSSAAHDIILGRTHIRSSSYQLRRLAQRLSQDHHPTTLQRRNKTKQSTINNQMETNRRRTNDGTTSWQHIMAEEEGTLTYDVTAAWHCRRGGYHIEGTLSAEEEGTLSAKEEGTLSAEEEGTLSAEEEGTLSAALSAEEEGTLSAEEEVHGT